ncbi:MAG: DUF3185 family protein [Clostridia bacterium]|nr:DUF3185 family protein [Clostridia bacterium]
MIIIGAIMMVVGVALAIYGNSLNNDVGSQLQSVLESGKTNPGNTFLYIGIALGVVGLILLIAGLVKKSK